MSASSVAPSPPAPITARVAVPPWDASGSAAVPLGREGQADGCPGGPGLVPERQPCFGVDLDSQAAFVEQAVVGSAQTDAVAARVLAARASGSESEASLARRAPSMARCNKPHASAGNRK